MPADEISSPESIPVGWEQLTQWTTDRASAVGEFRRLTEAGREALVTEFNGRFSVWTPDEFRVRWWAGE